MGFYINMKVVIGRVSFCGVRDSSVEDEHSHGDSLCDSILLSFAFSKKSSQCGGVSERRFSSLKSSRDSSRQYSLKKMYPVSASAIPWARQYCDWLRDSTTNKNKWFEGFGPQLIQACILSIYSYRVPKH